MLRLLFHVDIRYAIGASLVSVIATSSGAAAAYVREGYSNIRIGMFLETATTVGRIGRRRHRFARLDQRHRDRFRLGAAVLGLSVERDSARSMEPHLQSSPLAEKLRLNGTYPSPEGVQPTPSPGFPADTA